MAALVENDLLLLMRNHLLPYAETRLKALAATPAKPILQKLTNTTQLLSPLELDDISGQVASSADFSEQDKTQLAHLIASWYLVITSHTLDYTIEIARKSETYLGILK